MTKFLKIWEVDTAIDYPGCGFQLLNVDMIDNCALTSSGVGGSSVAFYSFSRSVPYPDIAKPWSYEIFSSVPGTNPWNGDFLELIQQQVQMVRQASYTQVITPLLPGWGGGQWGATTGTNGQLFPTPPTKPWPIPNWPYANLYDPIIKVVKNPTE